MFIIDIGSDNREVCYNKGNRSENQYCYLADLLGLSKNRRSRSHLPLPRPEIFFLPGQDFG